MGRISRRSLSLSAGTLGARMVLLLYVELHLVNCICLGIALLCARHSYFQRSLIPLIVQKLFCSLRTQEQRARGDGRENLF